MSQDVIDQFMSLPDQEVSELAHKVIANFTMLDLCQHVLTIVSDWQDIHGVGECPDPTDKILDAIAEIAAEQIIYLEMAKALCSQRSNT